MTQRPKNKRTFFFSKTSTKKVAFQFMVLRKSWWKSLDWRKS